MRAGLASPTASETTAPSITSSVHPTVPVVGPVASGPTASSPSPAVTSETTPVAPSLARLIGQKLVVKMQGTTPSADLLDRIRRGQIGGVILFGSNLTTPAALAALTAELQNEAAAAGRPPLLIATDQEGGTIKRIPWAPPTLSPPQMGALGLTSTAHDQGVATGRALLGLGINCDLAPVADVPGSTASFMYQEGRTWSFDPTLTTTLSNSFGRGLWAAGVIPAMKHFPGIGLASMNTDSYVVTLTASGASLAAGFQPYVAAIAHDMPMIMLSNATYTAFDPVHGAGWSRAIVQGLLRDQLGFQGVTITDSLSGTAKATGIPVGELALRAAIAGTDMILLTGSEASTAAIYETLLADARAGLIPRARLQHSYDRILALKTKL
jgi:beta-N-acetylhexosaminidase